MEDTGEAGMTVTEENPPTALLETGDSCSVSKESKEAIAALVKSYEERKADQTNQVANPYRKPGDSRFFYATDGTCSSWSKVILGGSTAGLFLQGLLALLGHPWGDDYVYDPALLATVAFFVVSFTAQVTIMLGHHFKLSPIFLPEKVTMAQSIAWPWHGWQQALASLDSLEDAHEAYSTLVAEDERVRGVVIALMEGQLGDREHREALTWLRETCAQAFVIATQEEERHELVNVSSYDFKKIEAFDAVLANSEVLTSHVKRVLNS